MSRSSAQGGYRIVLRVGNHGGHGTPDAVVELTSAGTPVAWSVTHDAYQPHMTCSTRTEHLHCVVTTEMGAHSSQAQLLSVRGGHFATLSPVRTDTPVITARDLDGDGDLDLVVLVNDYTPAYVSGGKCWQTNLQSDQAFGSPTGCTSIVHGRTAPAPTAPVHGSCPH